MWKTFIETQLDLTRVDDEFKDLCREPWKNED